MQTMVPTSVMRKRGWSTDIPRWQSMLLVLPMVAMVGYFVIYPLVLLINESSKNGFAVYGRLLTSASVWRAIGITFSSSLIVAAIVLLVAVIIGWTIRTTRRAWLRLVCWLCILMPFWMGTIVKNYAIILLISNKGAINEFLRSFGLAPIQLMYTPTAVILGISYSLLPFAVLTVYAVLQSLDLNLIRMAEVLGSTRSGAVFRIMLPLATPGFVAAGALVFALAVGFYVTPVVLGGAQAPFLAGLIQANIVSYFDTAAAAALSVILLICAVVIMLAALALVGWRTMARVLNRG